MWFSVIPLRLGPGKTGITCLQMRPLLSSDPSGTATEYLVASGTTTSFQRVTPPQVQVSPCDRNSKGPEISHFFGRVYGRTSSPGSNLYPHICGRCRIENITGSFGFAHYRIVGCLISVACRGVKFAIRLFCSCEKP